MIPDHFNKQAVFERERLLRQKHILNKKVWLHLTPVEFHPLFSSFEAQVRADLEGDNPFSGANIVTAALDLPMNISPGSRWPITHIRVRSESGGTFTSASLNSRAEARSNTLTLNYVHEANLEKEPIVSYPELYVEVVESDEQLQQRIDGDRLETVGPVLHAFRCRLEFFVNKKRIEDALHHRYVVYRHEFGRIAQYSTIGFIYVGITSRGWKRRWKEHKNKMETGSNLKFHRTMREELKAGHLNFIRHEVSEIVESLNVAYDMEEFYVGQLWGKDRCLNMIPGGKEGLRYLHEHNILGKNVRVIPEQREDVLSDWIMEHPRKGLPAPWMSERWKDPDFAASIICGIEGRLSIQQVHAIRKLGMKGVPPEEIVKMVKAKNLPQVLRVLASKTYTRI